MREERYLGEFVEEVFEVLEVDGFGEVGVEAGFGAVADVFVAAVAGEGDALDGVAGAEVAHEGEAAAVGEADVADDEVERLCAVGVEGGGDAGGDDDVVALVAEEGGHDAGGVLVVFDEEESARGVAGRRGRSNCDGGVFLG